MTDREKDVLKSTIKIIRDNLDPKKIILFGSRTKGNSKYYSDFDLAVETQRPDLRTRRIINEKIEKASGLYSVDLIYLNSVEENFKKLILKTGKIIYER